jgi:hypothetical protein
MSTTPATSAAAPRETPAGPVPAAGLPGRLVPPWQRIIPGVLCLALACCSVPAPAPPPAAPAGGLPRVIGHPPADRYTRTLQIGADEFALQTGSRLFRRAGGPDVDLVGAVHIAEPRYYHHIQRRLDRADLVLYEKVIDEGARHHDPAVVAKAQERSAYGRLASSLGLAMQISCIDYSRPHFRRSDMTIQEMFAMLEREMATGRDDGAAANAHASMRRLERMLGGRSPGMNSVLWMVGNSRSLQSRLRLDLVALGVPGGEADNPLRHSPRLRQLIEDNRNEHVIRDLQGVLREPEPHRRIAVFYGSAHLADLETRLRGMGYRPAAPIEWHTAVTSRPHAEGIPRREVIATLRLGDAR